MLARLHGMALVGIDARAVAVEVAVLSHKDPDRPEAMVSLTGLPDAAVRESIQRIRTALDHVGMRFPSGQVTVNLAPGDLKKEGPAFDLPIAVGLLIASGQLTWRHHSKLAIAGELGLDGRVRPVRGTLAMALEARRQGLDALVVPAANGGEAAVVSGLKVLTAESLADVLSHAQGVLEMPVAEVDVAALLAQGAQTDLDYGDVRGQEHVKRALTIAAAGGHNLVMIGPPGSGKTMLAKRLPSILPPLSTEECLETTQVYSARGETSAERPLVVTRPVRSPHHTASTPALVGGGLGIPKPGEVSLAHHGVLFLDEFPEFTRSALEALRQPMEDGVVTIARAQGTVRFPARFMLLAAMNPSAAGYGSAGTGAKRASAQQQAAYLSRVSGPLIDRIDLHVEVPAVPTDHLRSRKQGTTSAQMREQVLAARARQRARFGPQTTTLNAHMGSRAIRQHCELDALSETVLRQAMSELGLSARAHDKVLRIARTLADIAGRDALQAADVSEAIMYRQLDRAG